MVSRGDRMVYRFALARGNHEALVGVLHSAPGFPAFPVRLADEIFQRIRAVRPDGPVSVWDPCCGSGHLLTVLTSLHRAAISEVVATDADPAAIALAARNLGLLSETGLRARAAELDDRSTRFGRPGYAAAAAEARRMAGRLVRAGGDVPVSLARADALDADDLHRALDGRRPEVVITDVPYGERTSWSGPRAGLGLEGMLRALATVLDRDAVVAVAARGRTVDTGGRRRIASFRVGTRAVVLLHPGR